MVRGQVYGPDRPEQVGDDDVLLGLGAPAQLGAGAASFEQQCGRVIRKVFERVHLDPAPTADRGEALRLVQRFGVPPPHLEHDVAFACVGTRRDPRAVAAGLERLLELQPPPSGQRLDPVWQRGQPFHQRRPTRVDRGLQIRRHAQLRGHATHRKSFAADGAPPYDQSAMHRLPAATDFDGWVAQLANSERRRRAKIYLREAGSPAVPAVRRGMHHPSAMVRRLCASILDHLADEGALLDLVAALDDEDPGVLKRSLHALACDRCKENECRPAEDLFVPRALDLLRHPNPDVRASAIDTLGKVVARRPDVADALAEVARHDVNTGLRGMARHRLPAALRTP